MSADGGKGQPVGFCSLTESGRVEYCDGKPMFMAGPIGNYLHPVALYPHPDPVRAALVEALSSARDYITSELSREREMFKGHENCSDIPAIERDLTQVDAALKAAGEVL